VVIHGHTNVALRMVGVAGTSDIGKSKAAIVERFSKGFETA